MLLPPSVPAGPPAGDLPPFPARSPQTSAPLFTIRIHLVSGRLEVVGPLTHRTTHLFYDAVSTLLRADGDLWVVDVIGLTACDHSGLRGIGAAYRRAVRHDRRMLLLGASPGLRQALTRMRLDHHVLAAAHRSRPVKADLAHGARRPAPDPGRSTRAAGRSPATVRTPRDAPAEAVAGP